MWHDSLELSRTLSLYATLQASRTSLWFHRGQLSGIQTPPIATLSPSDNHPDAELCVPFAELQC